MAQRTIIIVEDDLDGSAAAETVTITYQGVQYELDLSERNFAKLQKALNPYLTVARRVGGKRRRTMPASGDAVKGDAVTGNVEVDNSLIDNAAVRAWAQSNGLEVSGRGRISRAVIDRYRAAGN